MGKLLILKAIVALMLLANISCSQEDNLEIQEEFLNAEVNGEDFDVDGNSGVMVLQKQLTSLGTINLLVNGRTPDGKTVEFVVYNYNGERRYLIGRKSSLEQGHFLNKNWCQYSEETTGLFWSTVNTHHATANLPGFIEISEDDGTFISGTFAFDASDITGLDVRNVSEGNFNLKLTH